MNRRTGLLIGMLAAYAAIPNSASADSSKSMMPDAVAVARYVMKPENLESSYNIIEKPKLVIGAESRRTGRVEVYSKVIEVDGKDVTIYFSDHPNDGVHGEPDGIVTSQDSLEIQVGGVRTVVTDKNLDGFINRMVGDSAFGVPGVKGIASHELGDQGLTRLQTWYQNLLKGIRRSFERK